MYHDDETRLRAIGAIMVQAFGISGRTLSEDAAAAIFPGWLAAFRTVPTNELECVRAEGLERRCTTADAFITVFEARMNRVAATAEHRWQQQQFQDARANAAPAGQPSPRRDAIFAKWRKDGVIA